MTTPPFSHPCLQHLQANPIPIALYTLSPVFTLCSILFDMVPFKATVCLLDALYPLYVFCGITCITGRLPGLGVRYLSDALVKMAAKSVSKGPLDGEEELSLSSRSSPNPTFNNSYSAMELEKDPEEWSLCLYVYIIPSCT